MSDFRQATSIKIIGYSNSNRITVFDSIGLIGMSVRHQRGQGEPLELSCQLLVSTRLFVELDGLVWTPSNPHDVSTEMRFAWQRCQLRNTEEGVPLKTIYCSMFNMLLQ